VTIRALPWALVLCVAAVARLPAAPLTAPSTAATPSPLGYWLNPTGQVTFLVRVARDGTLTITIAAVTPDVQAQARDVLGKDSVVGIVWDPSRLTGRKGRILQYRDGTAVQRGDCTITLVDGGARLEVEMRSGFVGHTAWWTRTTAPMP
jgi:hypothetical protein